MKITNYIILFGILLGMSLTYKTSAQDIGTRPVYSMQKDVPVTFVKSDSIPKLVNRDNELPVSMSKSAPFQNNRKCEVNNVPIIITNQKEVLPVNFKKTNK